MYTANSKTNARPWQQADAAAHEAAAALRREETAEVSMAALGMDLVRRPADARAPRAEVERASRRADDAEAPIAAVRASTSRQVTRPYRVVGRPLLWQFRGKALYRRPTRFRRPPSQRHRHHAGLCDLRCSPLARTVDAR